MAIAYRNGFGHAIGKARIVPAVLLTFLRNVWIGKSIEPFAPVNFGEFTIAPLERADIPAVDHLFSSLNGSGRLGLQRAALLWLLGSRLCLVAREILTEDVVGTAIFYFNERDRKEHTIHEGYIGLVAEVRGKGLATFMLRHALDHFSRSGFAGVSSRVSVNNFPALKTNQNLGFVPIETYFDTSLQEDRQYLVCDLKRYEQLGSKQGSMMSAPSNKQIYKQLSATEDSLPIFFRDWWLDATAGDDGWDVAIVKDGDQVVAALPYVIGRRFRMKVISPPPLTMALGPWLRSSDCSPAMKLANDKHRMQQLIDQLPSFDHFTQDWHHSSKNWLPFFWNQFHQTTSYTYVLPELKDTARIWSGFESATRASCKKALERYKLQIRTDMSFDAFLDLHRMSLKRRGIALPYPEALVRRLDAACAARGCRAFFIAVDPEGRHYAGNYIVWDEHCAYGLMNGVDPELLNSGAASLCMWEAIKHAASVTRQFDFCGSMRDSIERFIRGFGATQVPYFTVNKTPSMLLRARQGWKSVKRKR